MLHPEARAWLDRVLAGGWVPRRTLTPEAARAQLKNTRIAAAPREIHDVQDHIVDGPGSPFAVRIYRPSAAAVLPVVMFFHGGGWVLGDLELGPHAGERAAQLVGRVRHERALPGTGRGEPVVGG